MIVTNTKGVAPSTFQVVYISPFWTGHFRQPIKLDTGNLPHLPHPTLSFTGIESLLSLRTHQSWWSSQMGGEVLGAFPCESRQKNDPTSKFDEISEDFWNFSWNFKGPARTFGAFWKQGKLGHFTFDDDDDDNFLPQLRVSRFERPPKIYIIHVIMF